MKTNRVVELNLFHVMFLFLFIIGYICAGIVDDPEFRKKHCFDRGGYIYDSTNRSCFYRKE